MAITGKVTDVLQELFWKGVAKYLSDPANQERLTDLVATKIAEQVALQLDGPATP